MIQCQTCSVCWAVSYTGIIETGSCVLEKRTCNIDTHVTIAIGEGSACCTSCPAIPIEDLGTGNVVNY